MSENNITAINPSVEVNLSIGKRIMEEKIISAQTAVDSFRSLRTEFVSTRFRETRFSCRGPGEKNRTELALFRARRFRRVTELFPLAASR